jgi:hypothetical protein
VRAGFFFLFFTLDALIFLSMMAGWMHIFFFSSDVVVTFSLQLSSCWLFILSEKKLFFHIQLLELDYCNVTCFQHYMYFYKWGMIFFLFAATCVSYQLIFFFWIFKNNLLWCADVCAMICCGKPEVNHVNVKHSIGRWLFVLFVDLFVNGH